MCVGCWLRQSYPPSIASYIHHPSVLSQEVVLGGRGGEERRRAWRRVREIGVPRVRMGSKGERECSPVDEEGRDECAVSAPRNQDSMVPPSNATPRRGGPEGGGVPVLTDSPDTSVSG